MTIFLFEFGLVKHTWNWLFGMLMLWESQSSLKKEISSATVYDFPEEATSSFPCLIPAISSSKIPCPSIIIIHCH